MTTTWKIYNLERQTENGLVIEVTYGCIGVSTNFKTRQTGILGLEGDPTDPNFVAWEDLTEEIVIGWVKDELGTEKVNEMETKIEDRLTGREEELSNKTTEEGLPWG